MNANPEMFDQWQFAEVHADNVMAVWPTVEPIIARALEYDYDGMTTKQILGRILINDLQLICVAEPGTTDIIAVMTLEYVQRKDRICHCMTFSGDDMAEWVDQFIDTWRALASETGCKYISIKGRKGWQRYSKRYGFKHAYTQMYLEV